MTDVDIKEKLFQVWAEISTEKMPDYRDKDKEYDYFKELHNYKTAREIGALMVKDGIDRVVIAKILRGE